MPDVSWIKIVNNIFSDTKIIVVRNMDRGNELALVWFMMLTAAGKSNNAGYFYISEKIPYTPELFAKAYDIDLELSQKAFEVYKDLDMISVGKLGHYIVNWEKHQNEEKMQKIRAYWAEQKRQQRAKKEAEEPEEPEEPEEGQGNVQDNVSECPDTDIEVDKDIELNTTTTAARYYEQNINAAPSSSIYQKIQSELEWFDEDVITYAIDKAVSAEARNWNYIKTILDNWRQQGIKTLEQAKQEGGKRQDGKHRGDNGKGIKPATPERSPEARKFYSKKL